MSVQATNVTTAGFSLGTGAKVVGAANGKLMIQDAFTFGGKVYDIEVEKVGVNLDLNVLNSDWIIQTIPAVYNAFLQNSNLPVFEELQLTTGEVVRKDANGEHRETSSLALDSRLFLIEAGELETNIAKYNDVSGQFTVASAVRYVANQVLIQDHRGDCVVSENNAYRLNAVQQQPSVPTQGATPPPSAPDAPLAPIPKRRPRPALLHRSPSPQPADDASAPATPTPRLRKRHQSFSSIVPTGAARGSASDVAVVLQEAASLARRLNAGLASQTAAIQLVNSQVSAAQS